MINRINYLDKRRTDIAINSKEILMGMIKVFLPLFLLTLIVTILLLFISEKTDLKSQLYNEWQSVNIPSSNTDSDLREVSSDLMLLANFHEVKSIWISDRDERSDILSYIGEDFLQLAKHKKLYDQVRILDINGMEIVRVNYNYGNPVIVSPEKLQSKKDRYYFKESIGLNEGEVYISPLDLNIEFGKIEQPLKPMIRFSTPVVNQNGETKGIMILNYFGPGLLDNFTDQLSLSNKHHPMLLNSDGYWLSGDNPDIEWGFMYPEKRDVTFGNLYPAAWETIDSSSEGQFENEEGIFTYKTIYPLLQGQKVSGKSEKIDYMKLVNTDLKGYYWKVVSFLPAEEFYYGRNNRRLLTIIVFATLVLLFLFGSWVTSLNFAISKKSEVENRKLYAAIQQSPSLISITDIDGNFEFVNPKFTELTGYSKQEAIGKNPRILQSKTHSHKFYQELWDTITSGKIWRGEFLNRKKNGEIFWEAASISPITKNGKISSYIKVAEDVTERKKSEEELRIGRERLKMLNQIIRHDLSNEFVVIHSAARIFNKTGNIKMIKEIENRVDKSLATISSYKEYESFIDSNTALDAINLNAVLRSLMEENVNVNITVDGEGKVYADGTINSILNNLLSNAINHGKADKIDISINNLDNHCRIKFSDNGLGIPNDVKDFIFDEGFYYGDTGHTGIGLFIVQKTIQRYGGTISVQDNEPRGTSFIITLNKAL